MIQFPETFPQRAAEFFARSFQLVDGEQRMLRMHDIGCHTITRRGDDFFIEQAPATRCAEPPAPAPMGVAMDRFQQPGQILVISLAHRADRRARLAQHLREIGWPFASPQWVEAVDGRTARPPRSWRWTPGAWGCLLSHLKALEQARDAGIPEVMILEDDVYFLPGFAENIVRFLAAVPEDWQMLMPGGRNYQGTKPQGLVRRAWGMTGAECYIVKAEALGAVCEQLKTGLERADNLLGRIQRSLPSYAAVPRLAQQIEGFSDILQSERTAEREPAAFVQKPSATEGAIILSTGPARRLLAVNAAASFRRVNPHLGLQLVTDAAFSGYACRLVSANTGNSSRVHKTQLLANSPFERGVVLDDDTFCIRAIPAISEILGDADLAMALDAYLPTIAGALKWGVPARWVRSAEAEFMRANYPALDGARHFNSGVIFFRRSQAVTKFAAAWLAEWKRFRGVDQMALYRALVLTGIKVAVLPEELHARVGRRVKNPAIVHFTGAKRNPRAWMEARGIPYISEIAPVAALPALPPATLVFRGKKTYRVVDGVSALVPSRPRPANSPEVWGPPAWARLHAWAATCPLDPVARRRWLADFVASLPQCDCKSHWRAMMRDTPPPLDAPSEVLFEWTVDRHNAVNARKQKPLLGVAAARARWGLQGEHAN